MRQADTLQTRPCNTVFFSGQQEPHDLNFFCRPLTLGYKSTTRLFKADLRMKKEEVAEILKDLQKRDREPVKKDDEKRRGITVPRERDCQGKSK
jgi:hypothetical protein